MDDYRAFNKAVNSICQEKKYVAIVDGFKPNVTKKHVQNIVEKNYPHVVAIEGQELIGWCGIVPNARQGFDHVGVLGLGVVKSHRGKGIGKKLLYDCLQRVKSTGIEKVELEVFSDNGIAKKLYHSAGFEQEGFKRKARKLDGCYQDIVVMALFVEDVGT